MQIKSYAVEHNQDVLYGELIVRSECIVDPSFFELRYFAQQEVENQIITVLQQFAGAPNVPAVGEVRAIALLRAVAKAENEVASLNCHYSNSIAWQKDKEYASTKLAILRLQSQAERAGSIGSLRTIHWAADLGDGRTKPQ